MVTVGTRFVIGDSIYEVAEWVEEEKGWLSFDIEDTEADKEVVSTGFVEQYEISMDRAGKEALQAVLDISLEEDDPEDEIGFMPLSPERVFLENEDLSGMYDGMVIDALWEVYLAASGKDSMADGLKEGFFAVSKFAENLMKVMRLVRIASVRV